MRFDVGRYLSLVLCLVILVVLESCKGVPGYVIAPKKMARVLADIHTAEAVVDMNHRDYRNDSAKMALKQSVFEAHGITNEQFDTSLVWYGHNMDKYLEVYDKTIDILEKHSAEIGSMVVAAAMSMAGDSVDVWNASRYVVVNDRLPSRIVTFDLSEDENWEKGDTYTWRIKIVDNDLPNISWTVVGNYDDGTLESLSSTTNQSGWNEVTFIADSTKQLKRLRGSFDASILGRSAVWVDSIMLVRRRVNPNNYYQRHRQRLYHEY